MLSEKQKEQAATLATHAVQKIERVLAIAANKDNEGDEVPAATVDRIEALTIARDTIDDAIKAVK